MLTELTNFYSKDSLKNAIRIAVENGIPAEIIEKLVDRWNERPEEYLLSIFLVRQMEAQARREEWNRTIENA